MAFVFTSHMTTVSNQLWAVTSGVGAGLCFLVLLVIAAVWSHPKSRVHLDRVSFRIVVYALFTNMFFGIASAVGGSLFSPGFLCGFSVFILQLTLEFSSFLLFSIALNLQLVVVHGINGQRMERLYLVVSAFMAIILTVPPYAAGQYGWDPLVQDCWYTNDNQKQRLIWQVMTQLIWTAFTVIGEIVCSATVMVFMLKHTVRIRRVFVSTQSFSRAISSSAPQVVHANNYRRIILRVALYPLASCCVNLLSIMCVIHATAADGIHNETDYNILLLSDFLYGGRAVVYALLAASDPALVRGVRVLFSQLVHGSQSQLSSSQKSLKHRRSSSYAAPTSSNLVVHVELSTIQSPPLKTPDDKCANASVEDIGKSNGDTFGHRNSSDVEMETRNDASRETEGSGIRSPAFDTRRRDEMLKQEQDAFRRQI